MTGGEATAAPPGPIEVSLLTGFLGSGKTTLLNRLLRHPDMAETAVLINEFGDIGIDHELVERVDESLIELTTGCLCCAVQGDLTRALRELFIRRVKSECPPFRRVLIESTGLADPAPILHTLINDPVIATRYLLDGVIATADAVLGAGQLDRHAECRKQAAVADRIVITKTDLADEAAICALEEKLAGLNPGAPRLRAVMGEIDPDALFGCGLYNPAGKSFDVQSWLNAEAFAHDHEGHDHHGHEHRHDGGIESFCMTYDEPVDWTAFAAWVQTLITHRGENLLRLKGIMNIAGEDTPLAIHGIQHVFHPPVRLPAWPSADRRSRVVFITRNVDRREIEGSLDALQRAAKETAADSR